MILGDSYAFGEGVDIENIFARRLEQLLHERYGGSFEVILRAYRGKSTAAEFEDFQHIGFRYAPDMVITAYVLNDPDPPVTFPYGHYGPDRSLVPHGTIDAMLLRHSNLYALVSFKWNRFLERVGAKESFNVWMHRIHDPKGFLWKLELATLHRLHKKITQIGAIPVLVVLPAMSSFDQYEFEAEHTQVVESSRAIGFSTLDLLPSFRDLRIEEVLVSRANGHPNTRGHEIIAQSILKFILTYKMIPNLE